MVTTRAALGVVLLFLGAGCGAAETPKAVPAPEEAAVSATDPDTGSSDAKVPVLTLDAKVGEPVRGRLQYYDLWTHAEVRVKEVVAATPDQPARVRYTLRLCAEDGRTAAVAKRWSKEKGWKTLFTDSIYETAHEATTGIFFECPYGTAWEVDVTPEHVEGDLVRLAVRGEFLACTK